MLRLRALLIIGLFCVLIPSIGYTQDSSRIHLVQSFTDNWGTLPWFVTIRGNTAYFTDWGGIKTYDLTNPLAPLALRTIRTVRDEIWYIHFYGDTVIYANSLTGGGFLSQIAAPDSFRTLGHITPAVYDCALRGNYYYVAGDSFLVYNVINPASPTLVYSCRIPFHPDSIRTLLPNTLVYRMLVQGNRMYLALGNEGFQIYDITNPASPILRSTSTDGGAIDHITLSGTTLFCGDSLNTISIWDVSDPVHPRMNGNYRYQHMEGEIGIYGQYAYVYVGLRKLIFDCSDALSVDEKTTSSLPNTPRLESPYPNPFNSSTTIRFSLPVSTSARIDVFDVTGRRVETLLDGMHIAGEQTIRWNAVGKASGRYFVRLTAREKEATVPVMFIK